MNWRAKPLVSYLAIIQLIASTTTETGLIVECQLDSNVYEKGIKVSDEEMASLNVNLGSFHSEWNYTIAPRRPDG
jgi:Rhodopirellula transposase DDE domain